MIHGLTNLIKDIQACKNKRQEESRVATEMAKLHSKFMNQSISGYERKKGLWKIIYMHLLGFESEFGLSQAVSLMHSEQISEKQTGYIFFSMVANDTTDKFLLSKVSNHIKDDLQSNKMIYQYLALSAFGAMALDNVSEIVKQEIIDLAFFKQTEPLITAKAIYCVLRMFRKNPDSFNYSKWVEPITKHLNHSSKAVSAMKKSTQFHIGNRSSKVVQSACASLILAIGQQYSEAINQFIPLASYVQILLLKQWEFKQIALGPRNLSLSNTWIRVKLMQLLRMFFKHGYRVQNDQIEDLLCSILLTKEKGLTNELYLFVFEAILLVFSAESQFSLSIVSLSLKQISIFLTSSNPNLRYLGLELICNIIGMGPTSELVGQRMGPHQQKVQTLLGSKDISQKRRALDALYLMCTEDSAKSIVGILLESVKQKGNSQQIGEELVLKIAILAERYAPDLIWYIDTMIELIQHSEDLVTDDIWFRVSHIIVGYASNINSNNSALKESNFELQKYAATKLFASVNIPHPPENLIRLAAFVISEFAQMLVAPHGTRNPQELFNVLSRHIPFTGVNGRSMILTSLARLSSKYPDLRGETQGLLEQSSDHFDADLQQRAIEFNLILNEPLEVQQTTFAKHPPFSQELQISNPLMKRIEKTRHIQSSKPTTKAISEDQTMYPTTQQSEANQVQTQSNQEHQSSSKNACTSPIEQPAQENSSQQNIEMSHSALSLSEHINQLQHNELYILDPSAVLLEGINVMIPPSKLSFVSLDQVKKVLSPQPTGVLSQTNELEVSFSRFLVDAAANVQGITTTTTTTPQNSDCTRIRVVLTIKGLNQFEIGDVKLQILNESTSGFEFLLKPTFRMNADTFSIEIEVVSVNPNQSLVFAKILALEDGLNQEVKEVMINFPVFSNAFMRVINGRNPFSENIFNAFWSEFSNMSNRDSFKLDAFVVNRARKNHSLKDTLGRLGQMLAGLLRMRVVTQAESHSIESQQQQTSLEINAAAEFAYLSKTEGIKILPVLVQIASDTRMSHYIRLSIRGAGSAGPLVSIYQIITLFMESI